jgi:two-component system NarL family sensor kinase
MFAERALPRLLTLAIALLVIVITASAQSTATLSEDLFAGPGLTGIIVANTYRQTLDLALKLLPQIKQAFVVSGTLDRDKKYEAMAREELRGFETGAAISYLTDLPASIVGFKEITFWDQYKGRILVVLAVILVQTALIASLLIERRREKRAAKNLIESEGRFAKVFSANPQPMSLTTFAEGRYIDVNQSFLNMSGYTRDEVVGRTSTDLLIFESAEQREALLVKPLRTTGAVRNLEMKFRNKGGSFRILLSSAELVEIAGKNCILVASSDITERKESEERLAELTGRLLRTQDEERRNIARELHDVTAQSIGMIMLNLGQLQSAPLAADKQTKERLNESLSLGEQALKDIRTLSYVLHPPLLDQAGLVIALRWLARGFSERSGIKVEFVESGSDGHRMPPEVEYAFYRVVQECLTNIRRHTSNENAEINLMRSPDEVRLSVRDHGNGHRLQMSTNGDGVESVGVGIPGMRHRLQQLGGKLLVHSDINGTVVIATVPVRWVVYDSTSIS